MSKTSRSNMKHLEFLGYCTPSNLRLYRKATKLGYRVYLVPFDMPLELYRDFEISIEFALYLSTNLLRETL